MCLQVDECSQYLTKLHNNLLSLASLADSQQAQVLRREQGEAQRTRTMAHYQQQQQQ